MRCTVVSGGGNSGAPPRRRGRDSFAVTFLEGDLMSSVITAGVIPRPGVVPLMGEPCLAGVVPRAIAIFGAASTKDAKPQTKEPKSQFEDDCVVGVLSAVADYRCRPSVCARDTGAQKKLDEQHMGKKHKRNGKNFGEG